METKNITHLVAGFIEAAKWAGGDETESDAIHSADFSAETADNIRRFCETWASDNAEPLAQYIADATGSDAQTLAYLSGVSASANAWQSAGVDLYLTAAGTGAGFADRGEADHYGALDDAADYKSGQFDLYVGDDGALYIGGLETAGAPMPEKWRA